MRIALVFPRFKYPSGDPPLGLLYLASALRRNTRASVTIFDGTFSKGRDSLLRLLLREEYDLVGFSVMTTLLEDALSLARTLRQTYPCTRILFGGPHPTVLPEATLSHSCVDAVVLGEGEETLAEIALKDGSFENISGVWYKENEGVRKNPLREPHSDIDELEYPAWDLLPMERYLENWFQLDAVSPKLRGTNILSSRGCPYSCSYCQPTLDRIFGRRLRKRSPENIVGELKALKARYRINAFIFADDTFNVDRTWLKAVCEAFLREKLDLVWGCNVRANLVRPDDLALMKEAGLRKILLGIESGSQRILDDVYQKGITLDQVHSAVEAARSAGLKIQGYFMLGAPTETPAEIRKTLRLARKLPIQEATFSIATPLPQTHLFDKTVAAIQRPVGEFDYYKKYVYGRKYGLSQQRLTFYRMAALFCFYLSPRRLPATLKQIFSHSGFRKTLLKLKRL
jgi:anaerobic magnesium-protoporphyrin IX monomethyl ester cyclase